MPTLGLSAKKDTLQHAQQTNYLEQRPILGCDEGCLVDSTAYSRRLSVLAYQMLNLAETESWKII